jgi:uncharacterized protein (TIGR02391 family)
MDDELGLFEKIVRRAFLFTTAPPQAEQTLHPFETRGIHDGLPPKVKKLFDDSHYAEATFQAFKFVDKTIQKLSAVKESGLKLMMAALNESSPLVQLTACSNTSEKDEQKGYQFLFAGSVLAIRNPRGHEYDLEDSPDVCLDHLSLASVLLRRLEQSGYDIS